MNIFGLTITRTPSEKALAPASSRGGWWPLLRESYAGAWQQNVEIKRETVLAHPAVFACQSLIARDIAKLRIKLVAKDADGIWSETRNSAYSPVLRKPNGYQTRIQFIESWVLSKLQAGNAYILKQRDGRGVVTALHMLSPDLVTPLVSDTGNIYYELRADNLAGLTERLVVPAREVIHDRYNCFFHPLVGLSPIYANGLAATQGHAIQSASTVLFQNGARPGGILSAPGEISDGTAVRLKEYWDSNFAGSNAGKVAVLGDGLKYEAMAVKAVDAQVVEQLRWSSEVVCSTYHVPPYKIGVGAMPSFNNVQALNVEYYSQALQALIEDIEACLDDGLGMDGEILGAELDVDGLLRMDSIAQFEVLEKAKGTLTLNETRRRIDAKPLLHGNTVYMQQQDHSLAAIAARDAQLIDLANREPMLPPDPSHESTPAESDAALAEAIAKAWRERLAA